MDLFFLYDQEYGLKFLIHSFLEFSLFYRLGWKGINNRWFNGDYDKEFLKSGVFLCLLLIDLSVVPPYNSHILKKNQNDHEFKKKISLKLINIIFRPQ